MLINNLRFATIVPFFTALLVLVMVIAIPGCSSNRHVRDLQKYVDDLNKSLLASNEKVTPLALTFPKTVTFQANSERSPFDDSSETSTSKTVMSPDHPLQNYQISSLKFKGTVVTDGQSIAFILAPDQILYQVKLGDIIGNHYGKIVKIYPDRVEVEEKITDSTNLTTTRTVTLQLKD